MKNKKKITNKKEKLEFFNRIRNELNTLVDPAKK